MPRRSSPRSRMRATRSSESEPRSLRARHEVARRIDPPARGGGVMLLAQRPAVGQIVTLVVGDGALERHAAGGVAEPADQRGLAVVEHPPPWQRGQLGALVLDRAGAWTRL